MSHEPHETREAHEAHEAHEAREAREAHEAHIYSTLACMYRWSPGISESCPQYTKSFDQDVILSKLWNPDTISNTKSFDQDAILSNFGDRRVTQNDVLVEGFGVFGAILGSRGSSS